MTFNRVGPNGPAFFINHDFYPHHTSNSFRLCLFRISRFWQANRFPTKQCVEVSSSLDLGLWPIRRDTIFESLCVWVVRLGTVRLRVSSLSDRQVNDNREHEQDVDDVFHPAGITAPA